MRGADGKVSGRKLEQQAASSEELARSFDMPIPRHDLFPHSRYRYPFIRRRPFATMLTDFGCAFKCTFCIQRINEVRSLAEREDRPIKDGEIVTACQQACPTNAIIFGNVADKKSAVYESKAEPQNYTLLPELNTLPRTTYLAKFRNPNPALEKAV